MILFEKFGQHQPLNRQSERYAREGIELSLSTLADQVGACAAALKPLHALIEALVLNAERLHDDDTTVPILAKGKTDTGRICTGASTRVDNNSIRVSEATGRSAERRHRRHSTMPPAIGGEHPERHLKRFAGILQADAYSGYNPLFKVDCEPGPLTQALCWARDPEVIDELSMKYALARIANVETPPRQEWSKKPSRKLSADPAIVSGGTDRMVTIQQPAGFKTSRAMVSSWVGARISAPASCRTRSSRWTSSPSIHCEAQASAQWDRSIHPCPTGERAMRSSSRARGGPGVRNRPQQA